MKQSKKLETIEGLVLPTEWDEYGNPLKLKICANGEVDYLVQNNRKGERLLGHIQCFVRVSGYVKGGLKEKEITIKTIIKEEK